MLPCVNYSNYKNLQMTSSHKFHNARQNELFVNLETRLNIQNTFEVSLRLDALYRTCQKRFPYYFSLNCHFSLVAVVIAFFACYAPLYLQRLLSAIMGFNSNLNPDSHVFSNIMAYLYVISGTT